MTNPLFIASNADASNSERLNSGHIEMLKDKTKVDDWSTFSEGGWFCILGFKNNRRVLYAHCSNQDEFEQMWDPKAYFEKLDGAALDPYGNEAYRRKLEERGF